jgi:hypothetical protein
LGDGCALDGPKRRYGGDDANVPEPVDGFEIRESEYNGLKADSALSAESAL